MNRFFIRNLCFLCGSLLRAVTLILLLVLSGMFWLPLSAQQNSRRALVIGINEYAPPKNVKITSQSGRAFWPNLYGARNDAQTMKAILVSRFGFSDSAVRELYDGKATRAGILQELENLLRSTPEGGVAVFYFAGHGSQVRNSLTQEEDGYDESIVPADTWKKEVADIRDKELSALFGRFVQKKIRLTAIFDCCNSGSMARGLYDSPSRFIRRSEYDAKDASQPTPPEEIPGSGYLRLSAAQSDEAAKEHPDDNPQLLASQRAHGAFTLALMKALEQQSVKAPASQLFSSIRALVKSFGKTQEPVMAGDPERFGETLFGLERSALSDRILFPILSTKDKKMILQGGYAAGLQAGNELRAVGDTGLKLRIRRVMSLNQSEVESMAGAPGSVKAGDLFEVTNWVSSGAPLLKIYMPDLAVSQEQLQMQVSVLVKLKNTKSLIWLRDCAETEPGVTINLAEAKPVVRLFSGEGKDSILREFSVAAVEKIAAGKPLFVNLPPSRQVQEALRKRFRETTALQIVATPQEAHYVLYGTLDRENKLAYGLMRPEPALKDSLESLPQDAGHFTLADLSVQSAEILTDQLLETCMRLSKIRGWMTLPNPPDADYFPYRLLVRNLGNNQDAGVAGLRIGERISIHIEAENDQYADQPIAPKYIYVFTLDKNGKMQLLYPRSAGVSEGRFPVKNQSGLPVRQLDILKGATIREPAGTDHYFLLASETAIPDAPLLFNQPGVEVNFRGAGGDSPFARLLNMGNRTALRSPSPQTPASWVLKRLAVKVKH